MGRSYPLDEKRAGVLPHNKKDDTMTPHMAHVTFIVTTLEVNMKVKS
jgi:hypothetical protein